MRQFEMKEGGRFRTSVRRGIRYAQATRYLGQQQMGQFEMKEGVGSEQA